MQEPSNALRTPASTPATQKSKGRCPSSELCASPGCRNVKRNILVKLNQDVAHVLLFRLLDLRTRSTLRPQRPSQSRLRRFCSAWFWPALQAYYWQAAKKPFSAG